MEMNVKYDVHYYYYIGSKYAAAAAAVGSSSVCVCVCGDKTQAAHKALHTYDENDSYSDMTAWPAWCFFQAQQQQRQQCSGGYSTATAVVFLL